ncbi:MAG: hydrolase 1, exosortase A system-associated [Gammaproteobacteria bacterium]
MRVAEPVETALVFACGDARLLGVLHHPTRATKRGMLLVVGGPQYRVGSHRQFVLLAREVAASGFAVMRFDYRGMGDSGGEPRAFEQIDDDIRSAVDALIEQLPAVEEVVLWGLCDAASAILLYAHRDARIAGVVLLNPWVRTEQGLAKSYLRHYYLQRLTDGEFWRKLLQGRFAAMKSVRSLACNMQTAWAGEQKNDRSSTARFPQRMLNGLERFKGYVLVILSGQDLTAGEFKDLVSASRSWRRALTRERVERRDLIEANHTFSRRVWRDQVAAWTTEWMQSW